MKPEMIKALEAYESGELGKEAAIELFQDLVTSGYAWVLKPSYGHVAESLIKAGKITGRIGG